MSERHDTSEQRLVQLVAQSEAGVAQAVATFEAVERAYFRAVASAPREVTQTSYATTTAPR